MSFEDPTQILILKLNSRLDSLERCCNSDKPHPRSISNLLKSTREVWQLLRTRECPSQERRIFEDRNNRIVKIARDKEQQTYDEKKVGEVEVKENASPVISLSQSPAIDIWKCHSDLSLSSSNQEENAENYDENYN